MIMNTIKQANDSGSQRRGFFRRAGIFAAVAAVVTTAGGAGLHAYAQGGPGFRGGFFAGPVDPAQLDERIERMLKHLYVEINATPEQQQKLAPIVKQAARDLQPLRQQMHAAHKQAIDLMSAESIDRAAIERARAEHLQTADAASKRLSQALADAAEVLTPAQRKDLADHLQRRRGMGHRGMMHHG
jgi:Spy/CpxP family protein refolding chaperone